jgi:hypothetical protein
VLGRSSVFGCNDRMGWDGTIPQIKLFGSGLRVGTVLSSVVLCCPSKLEGRERMSGDDLVLAVLQPNTLVSGDRNMRLIEPTDGSKLRVPDDDVRASPSAALTNATGGQRSWQVPFESNRARRSPETDGWDGCLADNAAMKASAGCIAGRTRGSRALSVAAGRLPRRDGGQRRPDGACRIPPRHGPGRRRRPTLVLGVARDRERGPGGSF